MPTSLKNKTTTVSVRKKAAVLAESSTKVKKAIKVPTKTPSKNEAPKKAKRTLRRAVKIETPVVVPSVASLRLVEKVEAYRTWYYENFPLYVSSVTRVAGFSFILFGTLLTSTFYLADKNYSWFSSAALVCSLQNCIETPDSELPIGSPLVVYNNSLPLVVSTDTDFIIKLENTSEVSVEVRSSLSWESYPLEYEEKISDTEYKYLIRPTALPASTYFINARVHLNGKSFIFKGPSFSILENGTLESEVNLESLPAATNLSTLSKSLVNESPVLEADEQNLSSSTSFDIETKTKLEKNDLENKPITIKLKEVNQSKYLLLTLADFLPDKVEVYAEVTDSKQPLFLGLATLVNGEWLFSLSALDLPAVNLKVYAAFRTEEGLNQSESVTYKPFLLPRPGSEEDAKLEVAILKQKIELALENINISLSDRENYGTSFASSTNSLSKLLYEKQFLTQAEASFLSTEVKGNMPYIDSLLQRYASVRKTDYLIDENNTLIDSLNNTMANQVALDTDNENLFSSLVTILATRFELYKAYVDKIENEIEDATAGLSLRDTDKDGLNDLDEAIFYKTDIESTDTDMDGVIDSIEVINISDPKVSNLRSFVKSDSTPNIKIDENVVIIDSVEPLVMKSYNEDYEQVYASVQGKSLPNTHVAVIMKNPYTSGLIKTDSTGNFSYFIEKPLLDGNYEVMAALQNNDGELVVATAPYTFSKVSKEFTASLASVGKSYFEAPPNKSELFSRTGAAALIIVIFGVTLLLLAQSLRIKTKILIK